MLIYVRFSAGLTELFSLWRTSREFMEYTSPSVDFTCVMALREKRLE
jgi:hypothetical protein